MDSTVETTLMESYGPKLAQLAVNKEKHGQSTGMSAKLAYMMGDPFRSEVAKSNRALPLVEVLNFGLDMDKLLNKHSSLLSISIKVETFRTSFGKTKKLTASCPCVLSVFFILAKSPQLISSPFYGLQAGGAAARQMTTGKEMHMAKTKRTLASRRRRLIGSDISTAKYYAYTL